MTTTPRRLGRLALVACIAVMLVGAPSTASALASPDLTAAQRATLLGYARDTWASMVAMVDPDSGLPADSLAADGTRSIQTSTTNIGAYLWSAIVAERLGIIGHDELVARVTKTIGTLETMPRHAQSGQFFNWYDHRTG